MWRRGLIIIFLFYLFALLQNSFFVHFNLFGALPNLVFILFFVLIFFNKVSDFQIVFIATTAGFFLDILSYTYFGPSIILFIIIGFLTKKVQSLLNNRAESHPFIYFSPLFVIFLLVYEILLDFCFYFLGLNQIMINFNTGIIFLVIYNLIIASALFYIYKAFLRLSIQN